MWNGMTQTRGMSFGIIGFLSFFSIYNQSGNNSESKSSVFFIDQNWTASVRVMM